MNSRQLIAVVTELCDNVRNGLLNAKTAAGAIASAAACYNFDQADDHRPRYEGPGPLRYERPSKS